MYGQPSSPNRNGGYPPSAEEPILVLGETTYRRTQLRFGLLPPDRLRHLWLIGKTGSGKSTLLTNLIIQDLQRGQGLALLDPHGDLVEAVLPFIPPTRLNDTLLFSPDDRDYPVSFNVFRQGRQLHSDPALLASQLLSVFRKNWAEFWGPRLEHVLRNAILAIAPNPRATLVFLYRFLTDETLRASIAEGITDPVVRQFWVKEFPSYSKALQGEALSPALNKLGAFVSSPIIRNIVGQERSRLNLIDFMGNRGILLSNLASGRIGEDASRLLGGLLLTSIQLAAMERPRGGPPFFVYIDEFQTFTTDAIATMLAEARKFGLGLTLAHQYLAQLPETIRDAVLGNIGSTVLFRLGGMDAAVLEVEFAPPFTALDLMQLPAYHVVVKLLARGETLTPFSAQTLAPPLAPLVPLDRAKLILQSRQRYCQERGAVEAALAATLGA